jgi:cytochrome c
MDFERGNRLFSAILIALLVWLVSAIISETLIDPDELKQSVYKINIPVGEKLADSASSRDEIETIEVLLESADIEKGRKLFKQCVQCHSAEKEGKHRIGPNLWGVVGAAIATKEGFTYSAAAKAMAAQKWTIDALNKFLYKPRNYMSGTKMSFAGLKKVQDRVNIIAYLKTLA